MDNNDFQQIVDLLLDIKHIFQKGNSPDSNQLLFKIDKCISKIIPYVNSHASKIDNNAVSEPNFKQDWKSKSVIVGSSSSNISFDSDQFQMYRKSADEQILKINQSFFARQPSVSMRSNTQIPKQNIFQDYFILRYNLAYNDYEVYGKKNPSTDRKVFVDLLTFDNKRSHTHKLEKTESMTNILREIFSQSKPSKPFILPNFQEQQTKYLFVFNLPECASIAKQYYRTDTICCFVSSQFIIGELSQLMIEISRVCFEQQVNQASHAQQIYLAETISQLHGKKTYQCMEKVIEKYIEKRGSVSTSKLFTSRVQKPLINSIEEYLSNNDEMWSLVKRGKQQQLIMTLVLLYYLALSEYKIIFIVNSKNKHLISELILALSRALHPLTYIYPIVGTTITTHHFEFANSPVPIMVGFWGSERDCSAAKSGLKKVIKAQKDMTSSELSTETLLAVFDLEDHSLLFYDGAYKQTCKICKKIQNYLEAQTAELTSVKLSHLTKQLLDGQGSRQQQWMMTLKKNMKVTQMYDYLVYGKK